MTQESLSILLTGTIDQLREIKTQPTTTPVMQQELAALQLKIALGQPQLSQQDLSQVIIDMQSLQPHLDHHPTISAADATWIQRRYELLINQIVQSQPPVLSQEQWNYILDTICTQQQLQLDHSAWRGEGLIFENDQYRINLLETSIGNKTSQSIHSPLPSHLFSDPLFNQNFPRLANTVPTLMHEQEGGFINSKMRKPTYAE